MNDYLFCKFALANDPRMFDYKGYGYCPDYLIEAQESGGQETENEEKN